VALVIIVSVAAALVATSMRWSGARDTSSLDCEDFIFVPCPRQTATVSVPLAGSSFQLTYASDRVPGRSVGASLDARALGLGGWSLDVLHAYDLENGVIVLGNGHRRSVQASPVTLDGNRALAVASIEGSELYVFDELGRHLQTVDGLTGAIRLRFQWEDAGLASVIEPPERVTRIRRDAAGVPIAIVSARGYRTRLGVRDGWLAAVVDPAEQITRVTARPDGLVTAVRDATGAQTALRYEADGRLSGLDGPNGAGVTLERMESGDGRGMKVTTAAGRSWSSTVRRDGDRVLREYTDSSGAVTRVAIKGNTRAIATASGTTYRFTLAADPQWPSAVVPSVDVRTPSGRGWTAVESRTGALNSKLAPQPSSRSLQVGPATWRVGYEPEKRTITLTDPHGRTRSIRLNEHGRPSAVERSGLAPVTYSYDANGRITSIAHGTGPDARRWRYESDRDTGSVTVTDPLGHQRTILSDPFGRPIVLTAPDGQQSRAERDPGGRITAFTPPSGRATRWTHRTDGRVTAVALPGGSSGLRFTTYDYAVNGGEVIGVQFADGRDMAIGRDAIGRVETVDAGAGRWRVAYDAQSGAVNAYDGPGGRLERRFDGAHVIKETWSGAVAAHIIRELDRQARVIADDVGGSSRVEYRYDDMGRLVQAGELTLTRDPSSGLITGERIGPLARNWRYNAFGEVVGLTVTATDTSVYDAEVKRDALGRVVERVERLPSGQTQTRAFSYDTDNRLASVTVNGSETRFAYDANGNLVREAGDGFDITATYDNGDELLRRGETTYTTDPAGRLSSAISPRGKTTFDFDRAGHLHSVTLPSGRRVDYVLDGTGRRIGRRVDGHLVNAYAYSDPLRPAAELDAAGRVATRFVYALPSSATTYLIRDGKPYLVVTNELGTPRLLLNANGQVVEEIEMDHWGRPAGRATSKSLPFGLAGGLVDSDTGLVHFGARDYDPTSARWTAPDPIGLSGGDANRYRYASGDPVNRIDPPGTCDVLATGVTIGAGVMDMGYSVTFGHVSDTTEEGWFATRASGATTPGLNVGLQLGCLFEVGRGGSSNPGSPIDHFAGRGWSGDAGYRVFGAGVDLSSADDGTINQAGFHVNFGHVNGFSAQQTETFVWGRRRFDGMRRLVARETSCDVYSLHCDDERSVDPENEQNICSGTGICDPENPDNGQRALTRPLFDEAPGAFEGPTSSGDPHLRTANGFAYTFMAVGEFTALRSNTGDMVVQVRQVPVGDSRWVSVNSAVALGVNGDRVIVRYSATALTLHVNGAPTALKVRADLPAGGFIIPEARGYVIGWPDGSLARLSRNVMGVDLSIRLAPQRIGAVRGLLGPYTGTSFTGIEARNGTWIAASDVSDPGNAQDAIYRVFGESWRLKQDESLFDYTAGESTATYTDRTFPDPRPPISSQTETAARAICVHAGVSSEALAGCILDVAMTGEAGFAVTTALATNAMSSTFAVQRRRDATARKNGSLVVVGSGTTEYWIIDATRQIYIDGRKTNDPVDLPAGNYLVQLSGSTQSHTVREGQRTSITAGTAIVVGTGANDYTVYDAAGTLIVHRGPTNQAVELLPDTYVIDVSGSTQTLIVREGQHASISAGSAVVTGTGTNMFEIRDASGVNLLTRIPTSQPAELLPGSYTIAVNGSTQRITVRAGQRETLASGMAVVAGTSAESILVVRDTSGNHTLSVSLTARASDPVELLPGNYLLDLNGSRQPITVHPGERVSLTAGTVDLSGTASTDYFTIYEASSGRRVTALSRGSIDLLPGSYAIDVRGSKRQVAVTSGRRVVIR
jgi:RHS repeat-associated protein